MDLTWEHNSTDHDRFVIERNTGAEGFVALRMVDSDVRSFTDRNVEDPDESIYRIKACRDNYSSEYSIENPKADE